MVNKKFFRITLLFVALFVSFASVGYCRLDGVKPGDTKVLKLTYAEVNPEKSYSGYI